MNIDHWLISGAMCYQDLKGLRYQYKFHKDLQGNYTLTKITVSL